MRLTIILLTAGFLNVSAKGLSQNVTFSGEKVPLKTVFQSVEKQTGFLFLSPESVFLSAKPVTVRAENLPLDQFLARIFETQTLKYVINGKNIFVSTAVAGSTDPQLNRSGTDLLFSEDTLITVRGRVVDEKNEPIEGVSVRVKRSTSGTTTDGAGYFTLAGVKSNGVLAFSSVNIETLEVQVKGRNDLGVVRVQSKTKELEDVEVTVNTGYQTIPKERATGSFGTVSKTQLNKPSINISQRIIGAVAGVQARSMDADGTPSFEVRGQTSLYGNARPLVVVDGFPVQGDYNSINPNDVESITILKDAAAASIWGARAANGVIVITTKSAKKGTPLKVEFSAFTRVGKKVDLDYVRPLASSTETVDYEIKAFNNWSALGNSGSLGSNVSSKVWSPATVALSEQFLGYITVAQRDSILNQLRTQDNRQQIKDNLLANPVNQQYNLTLYGSSGKMSNALSLMFEKNQSDFKETGNERFMLNYRTTASVTKWLDVNLSAMVQHTRNRYDGVTLQDINSFSPYEMLLNPNGTYTNISQYYMPIVQRFVPMDKFPYSDWGYNPIQEIHSRDSSISQLNARLQAGLTFKLMKGLTINSRLQYETFNSNNRYLRNENSFYVRKTVNEATTWDQGTNELTPNLPKGSILNQSRYKVESWNFRNQLNYNRIFGGKHEINLAAGTEVNSTVAELFGYPTTYGYNDETLTIGTFPNGPGGNSAPLTDWLENDQNFSYTGSFDYRSERYYSSYANLAYTYDRRYTISGSYRTDASNLITDDPKYRYTPFWSIGGLWDLTREKFLNVPAWLDHLGLRATYGYNGNVDKSTAFMPLIATAATPDVWTNDYTASISSYGNPTLRWEKTGTWNLGLDYSLFNGRLFGKVDVYNKAGRDLIAQLSIPAVNGTTFQKLNNAKMTNRGIELELGTALPIRNQDIVWHGNLNFSYNRNRITDLFLDNYASPDLLNGGTGAFVVGTDANSLWRFQYSGVQNGQPTVLGPGKEPVTFNNGVPGDARTYLLNMGTTVAPYTLGFINSFKVYDFDFSFIITGKFGHVFQRRGFNYPPNRRRRVLPNNKLSEVVNGDPGKIIPLPLTPNEPLYYFWTSFHQYVSYLTESASHVRLQEVSLTYTIPQRLLKKMQLNNLQFYAQANDLYTWYKNDAKEDPEYPMGSTQGGTVSTLKPMPKLTLGLRLDF